jgi:hypothetical protein
LTWFKSLLKQILFKSNPNTNLENKTEKKKGIIKKEERGTSQATQTS